MVGASYYRELYLRQKNNNLQPHLTDYSYVTNAGKDLLNSIAFSIATNDFFIRMKTYDDGKYTYLKDRGYAFEWQLLKNTNNVLNKRLIDYRTPEYESRIPMMIFAPTIINDGRRLLISSQPVSFLSNNIPSKNTHNNPIAENVEFTRLFEKQDALNLKFTSAIRMSSTFPYIMPSVSLPSIPQINVLDAGMRDNYGAMTTYKYMYTFREWIKENTSGVVIIRVRDKEKNINIKQNPLMSIGETFSSPIGSLYANLFSIQDYNLDDMIQYLSNNMDQPIQIIDFELQNEDNQISLSWHLTTKEKESIINSMKSKKNKKSLVELQDVIKH